MQTEPGRGHHYLRGGRGALGVRGRDAYTGTDLERASGIDRIKLSAEGGNQYVVKGEERLHVVWRVSSHVDTIRSG